MNKKDFAIGQKFFTTVGSWICVDVGVKYIYAVREEDFLKIEVDVEETAYISVFDEFDMEGCDLSPDVQQE